MINQIVLFQSYMPKTLLGVVMIMTSGCAYLEPFVSDLNIISLPEEKALGEKLAVEILTQMKIISTGEGPALINSVGKSLVAALPNPQFDYRFYAVDEKSPNAFTIPGGHIFVHTGLLSLVESKSELAGVIAHEIGHAVERHPTKSLTRSYGVDYLTGLVLNKNSGTLKTLSLHVAQTGILTRYGRYDELEADRIGYGLAKKAGYSADGLENFLIKIQRLQSDPGLMKFLSSHPPTSERIQTLRAMRTQVLFPKPE